MTRRGWLVTVAATAALAVSACGGGGAPSTAGSASGASPSTVVTQRTAVVSADLDGDGYADLAALPRDGSDPGLCWRNVGGGDFAPAPASWSTTTALPAIAADGETCDDAQLTDGFAVRRVRAALGANRPAIAYAVLHLGDGAPVAADGPPTIDSIEPASGPAHTLVAIEGSGFATRGTTTSVTFGTVSAPLLYAFPDVVFVVVPDGLPDGPTEVRVRRDEFTSAPAPFTVTARAVPVVTSIVPSTVVAGTVAVLRGDHLGTPLDQVEVQFSGAAAARGIGLGRAAAVVVPEGSTSGPATISVNGVVSAPFAVVVGSLPAPAITSLSPASASVGLLVRIEGSDLFAVGEAASVTFNGIPAAVFGLDGSSLTAIVPPGATDGDVIVTVGGRASPGFAFDVMARAAPAITSVEPVAASIGDVVDVHGTDLVDLSAWRPNRLPPLPLLGDLRVTIGSKLAWFVLPTADGLRVVVPPGAVSGDLVVTVNGVVSNPFPFDVR